jgi:hypothetical protein
MLLFGSAGGPSSESVSDTLWHHRNLGKAFYENPTTQLMAVDEFKKALDLAPESARERVNYGLALLRAGKTAEGVEELLKAQKQDPGVPHTWFNLAITYKRDSDYDKAIQQFEQMVKLVPDEAVSHYNLGVLYKLTARPDLSLRHFEEAARLDPNLAGPHFQLYNAYRASGKDDDSARELAAFQEIKKRQTGAAVPEDLEWSYYSEIYDVSEPAADDSPAAAVKFNDRVITCRLTPERAGLAVLYADGDGKPDILAWSKDKAQLLRNGWNPTDNSGLGDLKGLIAIVPGDYNNDGLADLCVLSDAGAALYENKKGTFQKTALTLPSGRYNRAVWLDYDHDGDVDLFLLGEKSALARNNGASGFSDETTSFPFVTGNAADGTLVDLVADTSGKDLAVVYRDRSAVLYRDRLAGRYEAITLDTIPAGPTSVTAYDVDNDGWTDLIASYPEAVRTILNRRGHLEAGQAVEGAHGPAVFADFENRALSDLVAGGSVFRNLGLDRFVRSGGDDGRAVAIAAADFDQDGLVDLARIDADGTLHLLRNETVTGNKWLQLTLQGVKNAKLAPGAHVEVKAGRWYQKKTYTGVPLSFGVNSSREIDTVRITWPNGLIQNQPRQAVGKAETFKEAQRLSGSCPMIFAWNGNNYEFITDVLGVAPLGASSGEGGHFPLDHDEYVQIPGTSLALVDGKYEIRITEELHEVSYLDNLRLIALDHPADAEIFTNDKFKSPPFPEFRLFGVRRRIYPASAREDAGRDVTDRLIKRDRAYPDGFERTYSGIAKPHTLELDFGKAAPDNRAVLFLNGWVDWADGSTFLAASQESSNGLVLPYLQVKNRAGQWQTVINDMGIPAGKPKTIAVDLTGKFLSDSREVRIVTNMCVYWDEVFLAEDSSTPQVQLTPVSALYADLHFRGFSRPTIDSERKQPESFDYSSRMLSSMWNPTPGLYTRYGDVRSLLESIDDRMVIMGSGDEIKLLFPAAGLPELRGGWQRDFLLLVDGWAKDADPNTAFSQSVEPLPFHGMSGYPYAQGEHFPDDEFHNIYRAQYNTRPALHLLRPLAEQRVR